MTRRFHCLGLGLLAACLLAAPGFGQDVPEWEDLGFFTFAYTLSFYPGAAPDGSLDTLLVNGKVTDGSQVTFRRGITETAWADVTPFGNGRYEAVIDNGCVLIGSGAGPNGIQRTCNGGRTWTHPLWPDRDRIHVECLASAPASGAALGCSWRLADLVVSHDNGLTWDTLGATFPDGADQPEALIEHPTAAPGGGPRLVLGMLAFGYATSDDGGLTWTRSSAWIPGRYGPVGFAFDAPNGTAHDGRLYATARDVLGPGLLEALLASDDGGETWTTLRYFVTGSATVTVAENGDVWVGTNDSARDVGAVWHSTDGGQTWTEVTSNIDTREPVLAIRQGGDGRIYVAGRGVWRTAEPVSVASDRQPEAPSLRLSVRPNPSRGGVELALSGPDRQPVEVVVTDVQGREVTRREMSASSSWRLDVSGWAPGVYWARAGEDRQLEAVSFTVVR